MPDELEGPDGPNGPENLEEPPAFFPREFMGPPREPGAMGELIEVAIDGVYAVENAGTISRFVLLTDQRRRLPILIGPFEAQAISLPLDGTRPERPLTHDLVRVVIERLGADVDRVVVDDLWNTIYYAKVYLRKGDEEIEIDARPSDAIAIAVRFDAPIFVAEGILESAGEE
jgi:bifunctional DNase/RNase